MALTAKRIEKEQLINEAFMVLASGGFDGLTMRAIGRRLDVQGSALYWHVRDRAELVTLMADRLYKGALDDACGASTWQDWTYQFGEAFRARMLSYRDGARVAASVTGLAELTLSEAARMTEPLRALGLSEAEAILVYSSTASLCLGWATYEQNDRMRDALIPMLDFESAFKKSLRAIVAGLNQDR